MSEWRYIPGFDKHYEISSCGDVKSIQRNVLLKHRHSKTNPREFVVLTTNSGVFRFYVDDLVCRSFLPDNWFEFCKIIHLDGDITNNSSSNLICTQGVENLPLEVWKAPPELKNHVFVSNFGRVKRIDHIYGECEHLLRMQSDFDGYDILNVSIAGNSFSYRLHRLVATLFLPNPNNFPDINHKDGKHDNNDISNLEMMTGPENTNHYHKSKAHEEQRISDYSHHGDTIRGRIHITNGYDGKMIHENEPIPDGWYRGRPQSMKDSLSSSMIGNVPFNKGKKIITNGKISKYISESDDIPEGWKKGSQLHLSETQIERKKEIMSGRIYVTKGTINKRIYPYEIEKYISDGWRKGMYSKRSKKITI